MEVALPEAGGTSTQSGIYYQNSVAALALSDLLSFDQFVRREQVVEVRVEAPESIDDLVIRYADGHRDFRSIKLSLRKGSIAWTNLWKGFGAQYHCSELGLGDKFSIVVETETVASRVVSDICAVAESSPDCMEFRSRMTDAQQSTVTSIVDVLGSEETAFNIFRRTMVIVLPSIQIEREFATKRPTGEHPAPENLLTVLRDIVGGEARRRGLFLSASLRRRLYSEHGIRLAEPIEWGLDAYRAYLKRRSRIEIPGTGITRPADDLFVWPRVRLFDRARVTSFEDESIHVNDEDHERGTDLSLFPNAEAEKVIIVAGPGHGKTALISTVSGRIADSVYIPVNVSLASFSEADDSLLSYIQSRIGHELSVNADWRRLSEQGLLVLLLDGLDEVPSVKRSLVLERIETFSSLFPKVSWMLTVRDPSVVIGLEEATILELLPLNDDDIVRFADAMKDHIQGGDGWDVLNRLKLYPDIYRLARIPLFLSMLLSVTDLSVHKALTRSDLIEAYLRTVFLPAAHKSEVPREDDSAVLRAITQQLAFERIEQQEIGATEREVRRIVGYFSNDPNETARLFDRLKIYGILRPQGSVRLQFPYPIVQEYLAACHLSEQENSNLEQRISDAVHRPWAQVLQFALEMHSKPETIMRAMLERQDDAFHTGLRLVGRCIVNGATVSTAFSDLVGGKLIDFWVHAPSRAREQVGRLLADGFSDPVSSKLRDALHHRWLIHDGAGEIISRADDRDLTLSVVRSLIAKDRSSIMIYHTLKPALRSVGDEVLELLKEEMTAEGLDDRDIEEISSFMSNLSARTVSRDLALSLARNASFPMQARFRAFELAGSPLPDDGIRLAVTAFRSENWDANYEARDLTRLHPDPESFLLELLMDDLIPVERKQDAVFDALRWMQPLEKWRAFGARVVANQDIDQDVRLVCTLIEARHGIRKAIEQLIDRIQDLPMQFATSTISLLGHFPVRHLAERAAELIQRRDLTEDDIAQISSASHTGMLHIFEMDFMFGGVLRSTTPHPGIAIWTSLLEDWATQNDLSPQNRIRILTAATELGSEWAGEKLERELSQIDDMDAPKWFEGDEDGHTLGHALHCLLKRKPLLRPSIIEVVLSSKRYNIKRDGLIALANHGDEKALDRLIALHAKEDDWHLADTIANSVELLAARLAVFVREVDGKFEIQANRADNGKE